MDKQHTSVFSDYEPNDNSSINSKQLENWLKNVSAPSHSPKFGYQWTFMSNSSSRYEPEEVSFAKNQTFESVDEDKENNSRLSNKAQKELRDNKNKSYVNAMLALQKKVKTLQDENSFMRKSIQHLSDEKNRSISDSRSVEQELRCKLEILQPKTRRIDDLIEQNKKLRQSKDEKARKLKAIEKRYQELKSNHEELIGKFNLKKQEVESMEKQRTHQMMLNTKLDEEIKKLVEKNKLLEEMKQKSTVSILEKYNKSVELTEQFEKENGRLKKEIAALKKTHAEEIRKIQDGNQKEILQCRIEFEKLKENYDIRESIVEEKKRQAQYFREAYEKKDEQYTELVKSQHKINEKHVSESQLIQVPHSLIPLPIPAKKSFEGLESDNEVDFDESQIPIEVPAETKSVGKPASKKPKKSVLSSSQKRSPVPRPRAIKESKMEAEDPLKRERIEQMEHSMVRSRRSHLSPSGVKKSKKTRKNSGAGQEGYLIQSQEAPKTQPQHRITFEGGYEEQQEPRVANSYFYSAQYPPNPHFSVRVPCSDTYQVDQFQQRHQSFCSFDEAMLMELQRELLDLYEEQEKLVLASNDEFSSQCDRGEYIGRLKQLNEQLRVKNQKICELKSRI